MAFENTKHRYASFGIVSSIPGKLIDHFWFIIDHYLRGVLPLKHILRFRLKNRNGRMSISYAFSSRLTITVDTDIPFDPFYPHTVLVIDRKGEQTVALPDELSIL